MNASQSFRALRRANPRARLGFDESFGRVAAAVRAQVAAAPVDAGRPGRRRRALRLVAASLAAAIAVVVSLTVASGGGGPGVENATAAIKKAARLTAASAERSGTAVVRMTHDGRPWAGKTVRWNGADIAIAEDGSTRPGLLVVDGVLYGPDPEGGWLEVGSPASIDPDSGTTPAEHLAAVREDVGGPTLSRITGGMSGLATTRTSDRSTVYRGKVAAGLIARETGFKEGQAIRVLPFGYVAHDEAADPAAALDVAVTVGPDGIVRGIAVSWGTSASTWAYTVTYSKLGATPAPKAPEHARSLLEERRSAVRNGG